MKKGFKAILVFIIIILGYWYVVEVNSIDLDSKEELEETNYENTGAELLLVNKEQGLDKNYIPSGLSIPNITFLDHSNNEERHMAGIAIEPIEKLVNAAKEDGVILLGNSAYRSYKSQEEVYNKRVMSQGRKLADAYVAKPGYSEHQSGLCIDVTNPDRYFVKGTKEADWLAENSYRFGFIIRYPEEKKSITGIEYEPWHIRYVGEEAAEYIYNNKITLEEYLMK